MSSQVSVNLQTLIDQVAATQGAENSAIAAINGLAQLVSNAVGSGDDAALPALVAQLQASAAALAAAVSANPVPAPPAP